MKNDTYNNYHVGKLSFEVVNRNTEKNSRINQSRKVKVEQGQTGNLDEQKTID